jgi:glycosyltransferase involved in cell wall biosynthesis
MPSILFLTAYPIEDPSCRYRVHEFLPYLESAGYECTVTPFASPELFRALRSHGKLASKAKELLSCSARRLRHLGDLRDFDFVLIHREAFPLLAPLVEKLVIRRAGAKKVIFSFDDAIYAGHEDIGHLSHPWLYRMKHGRGYDDAIRHSACVIAGNRILADYARRLNSNVSIVPTVVDCRRYRPLPAVAREPLTIGWMGSRTTAPYLAVIATALRRIAIKYGKAVRFRFVGSPEYRLNVRDFESLPFRLETEIQDLQSFDIGLMPLPDSEWARGKCAFKAIQYMACGVATVASPVGITTDLIRDKVNGLLASTSDEWFEALDLLVRDVPLRSAIAQAGRRTVEASYSLEVWGPRFVSIFDQLGARERAASETAAA